MDSKLNKKKILAASVAGLLTLTGIVGMASTVFAEDVKCSGINACKGQGACAGKDNSCAGKNACKGKGVSSVASADECTKAGGALVPATPAA